MKFSNKSLTSSPPSSEMSIVGGGRASYKYCGVGGLILHFIGVIYKFFSYDLKQTSYSLKKISRTITIPPLK